MSSARLFSFALLLTALSCSRGVGETDLHRDLQEKLNHDVQPGLIEVVALRREGSAPLAPSSTGTDRVVVYFNVTLRLTEDYTFGGWDRLGSSSLAYALGATEKGLFGLKPENRAGDFVRAYGSAIYERSQNGWALGVAEPAHTAAAPNGEGGAPPSRSKQLIDSLAALVELPPPGVPPQQDEIIAEELARASENIERRVKRRQHTFTLATGPAGGEYARFGAAFIAEVNTAAPNIKLRQRHTQGSVENAWLLARGEADYAIVQGDVAAAAFAGQDDFARGGPLPTLRAVTGLFPEAIHVVVLHHSPVRTIADLRGRSVAVGASASGTQADAVAVLAAHGLSLEDLREANDDAPADALARLERRQVEAVFLTGAAPIRMLQQRAVNPGLRLLSLGGAALDRILAERAGLAQITLPANTYPQQREPVVTAAAIALLVTTLSSPALEVEHVSDLVALRMPARPAGHGDIARAAAMREQRGVTIPLHPGAVRDPH